MKKLLLILSIFLLFAQAQGQSVIRAQSNARAMASDPYGPELVTNGTFTANANGWVLNEGWAWNEGGYIIKTPGTNETAAVNGILTVGKTYRITFTVTGRTAASITPYCGWDAPGTSRTTNATFTENIVATDTYFFFYPGDWDTYLFDGQIDNVSVKEVL